MPPVLADKDQVMAERASQETSGGSHIRGRDVSSPPSRKSSKTSKKRELGTAARSDSGFKELLNLLTEQSPANTLRIRDLSAITLEVLMLKSDSP